MLQVKAVLTAALHPNVAVMDDAAGPNARPSWHDGQGTVAIHPSSINHPLIATQYMRPYLVYLEKVVSMHYLQLCRCSVSFCMMCSLQEAQRDAGCA